MLYLQNSSIAYSLNTMDFLLTFSKKMDNLPINLGFLNFTSVLSLLQILTIKF